MCGSGADYLHSNCSHGIERNWLELAVHFYMFMDGQLLRLMLKLRSSQSVVIVDPLATEAILGLDVLRHCVIDLSREQLITGAGHVVNLYCKESIGKQDSVEGQQHGVAHPVLAEIDCNEQSQDSVTGLQYEVAHPVLTKIDCNEQSQDSVKGLQHEVAHPVLTKIDCNEQSQDSVKGLQHEVAQSIDQDRWQGAKSGTEYC